MLLPVASFLAIMGVVFYTNGHPTLAFTTPLVGLICVTALHYVVTAAERLANVAFAQRGEMNDHLKRYVDYVSSEHMRSKPIDQRAAALREVASALTNIAHNMKKN